MRLLIAALAALVAASPAAAQETVRIVPGFEKVHKDLKKKEAEAQKEIARADAETDAADALRLTGEREVAESDAMIEAQRTAYRQMRDSIGLAAGASEAAAEARALAEIAERWAAAEAARAKGESMIRRSEGDAAKAARRRLVAEAKLAEARRALARTIDDAPAFATAPQAVAPAQPVEAQALAPAATALSPTEISASDAPAAPREPDLPPAPKTLDDELLGGSEQGGGA
jgi:hypothetical protein